MPLHEFIFLGLWSTPYDWCWFSIRFKVKWCYWFNIWVMVVYIHICLNWDWCHFIWCRAWHCHELAVFFMPWSTPQKLHLLYKLSSIYLLSFASCHTVPWNFDPPCSMFLMVPCSVDFSVGGIANCMGRLYTRVYLGSAQSSLLHCHLQGWIAMCLSTWQ